ncbi:hypothetical protein TNCV_3717761 [Trichonephila clavipes]|nr:hypothetical protein TNCV_3717761 [Trichonephila clavipes]
MPTPDLHDVEKDLNQVTWTTPELATPPPSPNFHTTPTGGRLSIERCNVHGPPTWREFIGTRLELMTHRPRVRYLDLQANVVIEENLKLMGINGWKAVVNDRVNWRRISPRVSQ